MAAGYVGTSTADAAAALSAQAALHAPSSFVEIEPAGFDAFAAQGLGQKISFGNTLILAKKPAAEPLFDLTKPDVDLTDPDGITPHLVRSVTAMRGDIPEISAELISQVRKDILTAAYQGLGHRYIWGGTSFENGWDCSGFVQWAYSQAGVGLPRTEQWLPMVETNNPQPGDIVVQNPDGPNHWSHIGIYIGNGKMISALNPSVGTILHTPGAVSSSSTYFTMPAFATADERAKADAGKAGSKTATAKPSSPDAVSKSPTLNPATTRPTKTPVMTTPATTAPGTPVPSTTTPATTAPTTTVPGTTAPGTTAPAPTTTDPGTTAPVTTAPGTTPVTRAPEMSESAVTDTASVEPSKAAPVTPSSSERTSPEAADKTLAASTSVSSEPKATP